MRGLAVLVVFVGCSDPTEDGVTPDAAVDAALRLDVPPLIAIDDPDTRPDVPAPADAAPLGAFAADAAPTPDAAPDVVDPDVVLLPDVPAACRGVDCSDLDAPCAVGTCDPASGACYAARRGDGAPCDNGNGCTVETVCTTGICGGGRPLDCAALDGPCAVGRCDAETGACEARSANEGGACENDDPCETGGLCRAGDCRGDPVDCTALDSVCATGQCDPELGCQAVPNEDGTVCDADDPCLAGGLCEAGVCVGEGVLDCSVLDGPCVVGGCDADGACEAQPMPDGTECGAQDDPCGVQFCEAGVCLAPRGVDCSALDSPCMVGVCAPGEGCVAQPAPLCATCEGGLCDGDGACLPLVADLRADFEDQQVPAGFAGAGDADWRNVAGGHASARALASGDIGNDDNSDLVYQIDLAAPAQLRFWFRVSSESGFDFFEFIVNGNPAFERAGEVAWEQADWGLPAGQYELVWRYRKDGSLDRGEDRAQVDDIELVVGCAVEGECVEGRQVEGDVCLACPVAGCGE